jgi:hypothetical protein
LKLVSRESGLIAFGAIVIGFAYYATLPIEAGDPFRPNSQCRWRLQSIGNALNVYAQDHNGHLPLENWCDAVMSLKMIHKNNLNCSVLHREGKQFGFALNAVAIGMKVETLKADTVLVFETEALGWNLAANLAAESSSRHKGYRAVAKDLAVWQTD